ncbi:uncharacterized protein LOC111691906 [Anoplophora glabripennis]|uniref:uncharacterized protein LOC111691906 n=1 Tax=Anoplophora glabripennis TaxID=217634 RepID=UPI000C772267|nr:uncharacterized protein LOC111691906 [Anoplophora glabripennis]
MDLRSGKQIGENDSEEISEQESMGEQETHSGGSDVGIKSMLEEMMRTIMEDRKKQEEDRKKQEEDRKREEIRKDFQSWKMDINKDVERIDQDVATIVTKTIEIEDKMNKQENEIEKIGRNMNKNTQEIEKVKRQVQGGLIGKQDVLEEERKRTEEQIEELKKEVQRVREMKNKDGEVITRVICHEENKMHKFSGKINRLHPVVFLRSITRKIQELQDRIQNEETRNERIKELIRENLEGEALLWEVREMFKKYEGLVSNEMRVAESYVHKLEVRDIDNFRAKTYPIPYMHKDKVRNEIGKLLKDEIIERSNTPYVNPLVIVTKKSGDIRICLDARTINKYTIPQYEAPLMRQDNDEVPIAFTSRVTKKHERNYSVSEIELASIIFTITKMRFYLLGNKFTVQTDNQALTSILSNKFGNNRIHRWALLLTEYDFDIQYIPGKQNILADALTRMDSRQVDEPRQIKVGINLMRDNDGIFSMTAIQEDQRKLTNEEKAKLKFQNNCFIKRIKEEELYAITTDLTKQIIENLHKDYGHVGLDKTWRLFRENYYSKHDRQITKNIIQTCHICQVAKDKNATLNTLNTSIKN